jgi:hypothetical protein
MKLTKTEREVLRKVSMFPPYKVLSRSRLISDRSTVFNYVINLLFGSNYLNLKITKL